MLKIKQNLRKIIAIAICFTVSATITVYSQTNKYGIYVIANEYRISGLYENPFKPSMTKQKVIAKIPKMDTIMVVDLIVLSKYDIFIETVIDGKNGFYGWTGSDKELTKLLKESKTKREDRLHQAYEYDKLKKDMIRKEVYKLSEAIFVDIYDTSLTKIGRASLNEPAIVYSYVYKYDESNQKETFYYKAVWNNQDVIINDGKTIGFGSNDEMFIGENVRRKQAFEQYEIKQKDKEKEAKKEEALKEKEEAYKRIMESYDFKLIKSEQEVGNRTNQALPKINPQSIGILTSAKGWTLCEDGQWASAQNKLPTVFASTSPSMENLEERSLGNDNFSSINLYKLTYGEQEYILLIKKQKNGVHSKYPIKQGWSTYIVSKYYVFDKSELDQLTSIKDGEPTVIKMKIRISSTLLEESATFETIAKDIITEVANGEKHSSQKRYKNLNLIINTNKAKNTIQFLLKENNLFKQYNSNELMESTSDEKILDEFKSGYYEMNYDLFSKFMKLP